jgi:hypothetical protein
MEFVCLFVSSSSSSSSSSCCSGGSISSGSCSSRGVGGGLSNDAVWIPQKAKSEDRILSEY